MRIIISLHIQPKSYENSMFLQFFSKKLIFGNIHVYFPWIQISESALTLWRHSDVIWSSMVLILVSMDAHTYTLVANIGVSGVLHRKSREGVARTPARMACYKIPHVFYPDRKKCQKKKILWCYEFLCIKMWFNFKKSIGKYSFTDTWCTGYPMTNGVWIRPDLILSCLYHVLLWVFLWVCVWGGGRGGCGVCWWR